MGLGCASCRAGHASFYMTPNRHETNGHTSHMSKVYLSEPLPCGRNHCYIPFLIHHTPRNPPRIHLNSSTVVPHPCPQAVRTHPSDSDWHRLSISLISLLSVLSFPNRSCSHWTQLALPALFSRTRMLGRPQAPPH